jgi:signal transduction histidine kinase
MLEVKHGDFRRQELLQGLGMRTVLFVPIVNAGEVTGVIECFFAGRPPADESLLSLVSHVGHQIGLAYDRAERAAELIESETRRRYVLGAMLRAEEEAKARLASDLHDDTIQVMVAAQLTLERISAAAHKSDLALVETATGSATETLRTAIERTRHLMFELRPQVLGEQGLTAAVNGLLEDAAKDGGFTFTIESTIGRYTRAIENLCYRVIQEAVSNVKRHAQAGTVTVTMEERNGDIACRIHDDGIGFDLERALDRDRMRLHLGLESMQERLTVSGGDLTITSSPGEGTTVCFEIPLTAAADLAT